MSSNGNGDQGGDASDWADADHKVVKDTRQMERENMVDTYQDLDFATNRDSLPGEIAADIAFNPFSVYSTGGEKGAAIGQAIAPGGMIVGAIRAASMTRSSDFKAGKNSNEGSDYQPPKRSRPGSASAAKSAPKRSTSAAAPNPVIRTSSTSKPQSRGGNRGILTGPAGVAGAANIQRKTLLGS